jgi:hypothetical protein
MSATFAAPAVTDAGAISPELVLVDPDLRADALARLPPPAWHLPARPAPLPAAAAPAPAPATTRRERGRLGRLGAALVAAVAVAAGVLELPQLVERGGTASTSTVPPGRLLVWAPARDASGYRILVVQGERIVVDTVTPRPKLRLDLPRGAYRWWVWPILRSGESGPAVVQSSLVIQSG